MSWNPIIDAFCDGFPPAPTHPTGNKDFKLNFLLKIIFVLSLSIMDY